MTFSSFCHILLKVWLCNSLTLLWCYVCVVLPISFKPFVYRYFDKLIRVLLWWQRHFLFIFYLKSNIGFENDYMFPKFMIVVKCANVTSINRKLLIYEWGYMHSPCYSDRHHVRFVFHNIVLIYLSQAILNRMTSRKVRSVWVISSTMWALIEFFSLAVNSCMGWCRVFRTIFSVLLEHTICICFELQTLYPC